MRLIDADKQLELVDCTTHIHGIGLEPVVAVDTVRDLIKGAPTIDAIPIPWIISWCFKRYMETKVEISVPEMIEAWWKEQEAR